MGHHPIKTTRHYTLRTVGALNEGDLIHYTFAFDYTPTVCRITSYTWDTPELEVSGSAILRLAPVVGEPREGAALTVNLDVDDIVMLVKEEEA